MYSQHLPPLQAMPVHWRWAVLATLVCLAARMSAEPEAAPATAAAVDTAE